MSKETKAHKYQKIVEYSIPGIEDSLLFCPEAAGGCGQSAHWLHLAGQEDKVLQVGAYS